MLDTLDAAAVRRWCSGALAALHRHQGEIDALNVYPVPDGDTGTNLVLTLTSAQHALALDLDNSSEGEQTSHGRVLRLMARGALLGARGNSGVIVSQILRALADALTDTAVVRGRALASALTAATDAAYAAVARPVEGTVLTVVAAAARAADRTGSDDLATVVRAAASAARDALAATPGQLPVLARAGVVDAGGRGLCLLLDALAAVVGTPLTDSTGDHPADPGDTGDPADRVPGNPGGAGPAADPHSGAGSEGYAYEVQFLLEAPAGAVDRMRAALAEIGDSLVVVGSDAGGEDDGGEDAGGEDDGDGPVWNVHVHVDDIGAAVEAGIAAGRPYQISVTRFADQPAPPLAGRAAVVVAAGTGLAALFTGEGAGVVGGSPSTAELLDAIRRTGAAEVVVLPNDPDTQAVAGLAAREAEAGGVTVAVVPTRSPVQALAALAVRDPRRRFDDDVIAMAEAAGACRYAEVCHAAREALTVAGRCRPGDVLALVEGEVLLIGTDLAGTCRNLLDQLLGGGGELVTLIVGEQAPDGLGDAVAAHVARCWPFVEVHTFVGGQPHYPLLVGIE
ncbi:DAK2 domain-containing protein [Solwaraspora sp. WMMA2080]|uniref:DAK2 domain-containing protein n=1 Tax=unclassified Solwaraspora TaxID=2627926 RepID=UPI00248C567C|nr:MULTISPECIES: DAK2 domain-containing protein [unclassified Solwaraspora]WBB98482.1 DAK2 domain-containing protein [Solwaraspora sp. WMMA2059]WBC22965.1 DAK2 domain-containing protein [Solwaraspora sp. WMMA2080]